MNHKLLAGLFLVISLTCFGACGYMVHLRNQRDDAQARVGQLELEADGYRASLASKPGDIIKLIPTFDTPPLRAAIKKGTIQPVAATKTTAHKDLVVELPVPSSSTPDPQVGSHEPDPGPSEVPVHLTFTSSMLITRIKFGIATEWKAESGGTIAVGGLPPQGFTFKDDEVSYDVRFSDDIAKALADHERGGGWLKRHTKLLCPGVGVTYNPIDTVRPVNVGVVCAYGFSWF